MSSRRRPSEAGPALVNAYLDLKRQGHAVSRPSPASPPTLAASAPRARRTGGGSRTSLTTRRDAVGARAHDEELLALPVLYRGALSSLSVARETSLDLELVAYLEGLCARAYFFVYGVRTSAGQRLGAFFARDWPAAVRSLWRETLGASLLITVIGALAGYLLVAGDPSWYDSFVPTELAGGRDFNATTESLRATLYHDDGAERPQRLRHLSCSPTTARSAMLCFALGFAFGVPTAMLLDPQRRDAGRDPGLVRLARARASRWAAG